MATNRVTTEGLEVLRDGPAQARVTTEGMEVLHSGNVNTQARVTSLGLEVLHAASTAKGRVSALGLEVLRSIATSAPVQIVTRFSQFGLSNVVGSVANLGTGSGYWTLSHPSTNPSPGLIQIDFGYKVKLKSWAFIKSLGTMGDWDIVGSNFPATSTADAYVSGNGDVRLSTFHDVSPGPGQDLFSAGQNFSGGSGFRYYRLLLVGPIEPSADVRLTGILLNAAIVMTPFGFVTQSGSQVYTVDSDLATGWLPAISNFAGASATNIPALQFDMGEPTILNGIVLKTGSATALGPATLWGSNNPATSTADTIQSGDVQIGAYTIVQMNNGSAALPVNSNGVAYRYYRFAFGVGGGPDGAPVMEFIPSIATTTYAAAFSDGTSDILTVAITIKDNPVLTINFTDEADLETFSSIYPSIVVQTMVHTSGRG